MKTNLSKHFLLFTLFGFFAGLGLLNAQGTLVRTQYGTKEGPEPPPNRPCITAQTINCGALYQWSEQLVFTPTFPYSSVDDIVVHVDAPAGLHAFVQDLSLHHADPSIESDPGIFWPTRMTLPYTLGPVQYSSTGKVYLYLEFIIELCPGSEPIALGDYEFNVTINGTQYSSSPVANPEEEGNSGSEGTYENLGAPFYSLPFSLTATYDIEMLEEVCVDEEGNPYPILPPVVLGPSTHRSSNSLGEKLASYSLYPNPSTSHTILKLDVVEEGDFEVRILDTTGRLVGDPVKGMHLGIGTHKLKLDLQDLSAGLYLVQIENQGKVYSEKLLKN